MNEPELRDVMKDVAHSVKRVLPPKTLFVVLAFDDAHIAQYVANGERADIILALRECANRLDARDATERVPFP